MRLRSWLDRVTLERDLRWRTERQYLHAVNAFEHWLGHPASVRDLAGRINEFLRDRRAKGSPYTTKSIRGALLSLLSAASDARLIRRPDRVRPIHCPDLIPRHVAPDVLHVIEAACLTGRYGAMQWAALKVAWDTGLRLGNVLTLTWGNVDEAGVVRVIQEKTRRVTVAQIRPETLALCRGVRVPGDARLIPWPLARSAWHRWFLRLRRDAGLDWHKLGLQAARRTAADKLARERGVLAAVKFLGHSPQSGEQVARRYYLSADACGTEPVLPPDMFE